MAILMAMKRVSVAQAKNGLPALLHEAEREPVEIQRRGRPVAVLLSTRSYERLVGKQRDAGRALARFRERYDVAELELVDVFAERDGAAARPARW